MYVKLGVQVRSGTKSKWLNKSYTVLSSMLLIARHGKTKWNSMGKMQGQQDSPLTKEGKKQARKLAQVVDTYEIERVVSSPLGRAEKTAKVVSNHANIPMETDDNLKEIDIGRYSGLTKDEVKERNPEFFSRRESNKWTCSWPDGESYKDASERAKEFIENTQQIERTVILAHQSINRVVLGQLLNLSPEEILNMEQKNNVLFEVDSKEEFAKRNYYEILQQ